MSNAPTLIDITHALGGEARNGRGYCLGLGHWEFNKSLSDTFDNNGKVPPHSSSHQAQVQTNGLR
ncbi:hypothetical protein [Mesorhizobium sp. LjNodule214]|uniref:hypothetical protein n=1 Tax=Mesorhizobium sp. LjNodule214 TaxID=3342252 RepID=UPI003ECCB04B